MLITPSFSTTVGKPAFSHFLPKYTVTRGFLSSKSPVLSTWWTETRTRSCHMRGMMKPLIWLLKQTPHHSIFSSKSCMSIKALEHLFALLNSSAHWPHAQGIWNLQTRARVSFRPGGGEPVKWPSIKQASLNPLGLVPRVLSLLS